MLHSMEFKALLTSYRPFLLGALLAGALGGLPWKGALAAHPELNGRPPQAQSQAVSAEAARAKEFEWHDAQSLTIKGLGWKELQRTYTRLPAKAQAAVTPEVWKLSQHSAGGHVQFLSNSQKIKVRWSVRGNNSLNHMAPTAVKGVDLYVRTKAGWQWAGVGKPSGKKNEVELVSSMVAGEREFMLYLPLYDGVDSVSIGVEKGASIKPLAGKPEKPIVFYGTSITQGACATRAGMAYPSIIGRQLNRETINLGFSGNGKMHIELAHLLTEIDASLYVLDNMPNMQAEDVEPKAVAFVKHLRAAQPHTPILLVENLEYAHGWVDTRVAGLVAEKNKNLRKAYEQLKAAGVTNLFYLNNQNLALANGEGTVDGIHLTDLGFAHLATELTKEIRKVEKKARQGC
ncbi:hypothetical protein FOE74_05010 [Rufibacter glacialis]|uniref:Hydrolase n=2 Tax=Rufibacter glacialis TaxID=1259555 RepID=A0A5M8QJZ1_9BACT|nr:hypothetical protein FOE74_05010 [Rufibacter glacialis]